MTEIENRQRDGFFGSLILILAVFREHKKFKVMTELPGIRKKVISVLSITDSRKNNLLIYPTVLHAEPFVAILYSSPSRNLTWLTEKSTLIEP